MVSCCSRWVVSFHVFSILLVYILSVKLMEGVTLRYFSIVNEPLIGMLCCIPLRQSFIRFDFSSLLSLVVMEFDMCPV